MVKEALHLPYKNLFPTDTLRKCLQRSYEPTRHHAALSLGSLGDEDSAPKLRAWLAVADDENYRGVAAEALGDLRDAGSVPALQAALEVEPFPWVREKLAEALRKIGGP